MGLIILPECQEYELINVCYFKNIFIPFVKYVYYLKFVNELMDSVVPEKIMKLFSLQFIVY